MRTISPKYAKGSEPPRTLADDLRVLRYILFAGFNYLFVGRRIRKEWWAKKRRGEKYYVDED
jgi:hypothetical protein